MQAMPFSCAAIKPLTALVFSGDLMNNQPVRDIQGFEIADLDCSPPSIPLQDDSCTASIGKDQISTAFNYNCRC